MFAWLRKLLRRKAPEQSIVVNVQRSARRLGEPLPPPDGAGMQVLSFRDDPKAAKWDERQLQREAAKPFARITAWHWLDASGQEEGIDIFVDGEIIEDYFAALYAGEKRRPLPPDAAERCAAEMARLKGAEGSCVGRPKPTGLTPMTVPWAENVDKNAQAIEDAIRAEMKLAGIEADEDEPLAD